MKAVHAVFLSLIFLAGCEGSFRTRGPVTTEKRNITGFHAISSDGIAEVILVNDQKDRKSVV